MAKSKTDQKKQKRKAKKKQVKTSKSQQTAREKGWVHYEDARYYFHINNIDKALKFLNKAVKALPNEEDIFQLMGHIASSTGNELLELDAMSNLERIGKLPDDMKIEMVYKLLKFKKHKECKKKAGDVLENFTKLKIKDKKRIKEQIKSIQEYCLSMIRREEYEKNLNAMICRSNQPKQQSKPKPEPKPSTKDQTQKKALKPISQPPLSPKVPDIPITYKINEDTFFNTLLNPEPVGPEAYELALMSHEIRFAESFENLICLPSLIRVKSFWYQEETAKKVLKRFRGRALLSDEVGLGKTIEALIILTEYIKRGMVKTALILTPTPLVSQWKDEMKSKFNMDIPSTDDPGFKSASRTFWNEPFVIASINQAKSKKNYDMITSREYDMIIVDEAHHLKNRTTLNWKLVNSLKKRFILLLTATPVENNLMELYNLITLLKPGQLETATSFREKFMKSGDPTDPQNRTLLKDLLGQVMIRNTRALAGINIPPRFAQTIRIEPTKAEKEFYERLEALITSLNAKKKGRAKMVIKNLLAQAGSSPKAVESTLTRMLEKEDYLLDYEKEIRAVRNLCRTTLDTPKNMNLLKIIRATGEKIIVFVKYKGTIEHLAEFLEWNEISFSLFHGAMNNHQKDEAIEAFKDQNQILVTTEIGGEGRNLQFCSRMINYDLPWNPMKIEQRIGRIHRIGQENEVQIFNFCATGSIEDYILDILDKKINMFEMVIGEIDMILGRIRGEKEFSDIVYDIWVNSENKKDRKDSFANLGTRIKRAKTGYDKTRELDDKLFGDTYEL
ncbi:SNF2-related protein [Desulfobacula toluolica]|uniref:Predicted ATP-dependent RNA helicase n=1 Tax=Desulfobacula toluolica (strain DSM 7467 / Tol2) TaxID=651182 RepID=K0N8Z9_DESTT|nr:SNF2-related protein [Desulfobacula toluolica]CCK80409.1 predicted ATP-dependent RNA helicase [Desulfobacula toluolica Tol2]